SSFPLCASLCAVLRRPRRPPLFPYTTLFRSLIGANGAGKSTLMMSIFGRPRASSGHIVYDGSDITQVPTHQIARLRIAQSPEGRSEEHTSELQSRFDLVCRLLLEKKKTKTHK